MDKVDEGIEAMLCCWLQQLQEFGGPEVDKPDLLKGSIGSLKNLGLANATNSTRSATGSTSAVKPTPCLDKRARYNVCKKKQQILLIRLYYVEYKKKKFYS